jgi:hypothetical protein
MKAIFCIFCCGVFLIACETKITTINSNGDTTIATSSVNGNVLDTLEQNIDNGWDSVKAKVKQGSEDININGDTLKSHINETIKRGSGNLKKGADSLKNKIDRTIERTFPNKKDKFKK